jgi:hypothetical protein
MASKAWCKLAAESLGWEFDDHVHPEWQLHGASTKPPYKYWLVRRDSNGKRVLMPQVTLKDCETFLQNRINTQLGR